MVRRLNFPGTLQTEDPDQYLALVETLGDPDDGGTRPVSYTHLSSD